MSHHMCSLCLEVKKINIRRVNLNELDVIIYMYCIFMYTCIYFIYI